MRKRKISKAYSLQGNREVDCTEIHSSGPTMEDLPGNILVDILLKLSVKSIVMCKCVCKNWHLIISDPEFAKLHFSQVDTYPIIRTSSRTRIPRILYLVQLEQERDFFLNSNIKLDTKLKLPVRNFQLESHANDDGSGINSNLCLKLRAWDHTYMIVNSCNGLFCLSEPSYNNPVAVCNPVTGEFIELPDPEKGKDYSFYKSRSNKRYIVSGLGFSPLTNKYKVIRILPEPQTHDAKAVEGYCGRSVEIHTLGTKSWRDVGVAPLGEFSLDSSTYLNGVIHWIHFRSLSDFILSFHVEEECFQTVPSPPVTRGFWTLGVLRGYLCVCDSTNKDTVSIWVMKHYGVEKSWIKICSLNKINCCGKVPAGPCRPLKLLKNGALLLFSDFDSALIYFHPRTRTFMYFTIEGIQTEYEAFAHTPSFISLNDILAEKPLEDFHISSRSGNFKLLGECRAISLVKEISNCGKLVKKTKMG